MIYPLVEHQTRRARDDMRMRIVGAARLFVLQACWRSLGVRSAGRALVRGLGESDDDLRTIAGMFLVRAGNRSVPYLKEAVDRRENLEMAARVIGDLGAVELEPDLRALTQDSDPCVVTAARDALRLLALSSRSASGLGPTPTG